MSAQNALERDTRGLAVEFEHVHHSFLHGDRPVRVLEDFNLRIEPLGVRQHRRALRVRQDHALSHDRWPREGPQWRGPAG